MGTKRILLIIAGVVVVFVLGCGLLLGGGVFVIFQTTAPVREAGTEFMQALSDGDYDSAYAKCAPSLQAEFGSPENMGSMIEASNARPQSWDITSSNIENSQGTLEGTVETGGGTLPLRINLVNNDEWQIIAFNFGT